MKNAFLVLLLVASTIQISYGQFSIGLEGGGVLSNVKYDGGYDFLQRSTSTNYFISLAPRHSFNKKLSFIADISYIQKGYKVDFRSTSDKSIYRLSYLNITPQIEYKAHKNLGIGLGFYGGSKLKEQLKFPDEDWSKTPGLFKSLDVGLTGSIRGYYKNFYLKVTYEYGLQNITNAFFTDDTGTFIDTTIKNRSFQIGLGYLLNISSKSLTKAND